MSPMMLMNAISGGLAVFSPLEGSKLLMNLAPGRHQNVPTTTIGNSNNDNKEEVSTQRTMRVAWKKHE